MQQCINPLGITNSQLAQAQAYQKAIVELFMQQFKGVDNEKQNFFTNLPTVIRFSIARQFKKSKIIEMWRKWVQWYCSYKPNQIHPTEASISKLHKCGKYRYSGQDKQGCPILIIRMKYHIKGMATLEQNLRYLIFMIQKGVKLASLKGKHQLSVIYDRRELAESDEVSKQSMKKFMPMLSDYYPQILKSFYVLGANLFYRAMWKIVSVFVSKRTEDKINLLEDVEQLQKFISRDQLEQQYGGTLLPSNQI